MAERRPRRRTAPVMRVSIRGQEFPSARAAADHFGVAISTVRWALAAGRIDHVGLGRGSRPRESRAAPKARPITIGGIRFASLQAASAALGFNPKYLAKALRVGKERARARVAAAALAFVAKRENRALKEWVNG